MTTCEDAVVSNKLKITYRPTESLIPYARNSRTHSPEQVAQIAASIREFGFTNPVLVDEQQTIIAGHGRVLAAQKLGLPEVPTIHTTTRAHEFSWPCCGTRAVSRRAGCARRGAVGYSGQGRYAPS